MQYLFIPSQARLNAIHTAVTNKFGFVDTIRNTITSIQGLMNNMESDTRMTYSVQSRYYTGDIDIVNLSWYTPFKPYGDIVITGFCYLFFIWRLFIHVPNTINGLGGEINFNATGINNIRNGGNMKK